MDDLNKTQQRSPAPAPKKKNRLPMILFVALNVAIIGVTAIIDFSKEGRPVAPLGINMRYLFAAAGCFLAVLALETFKYYVMMREMTGHARLRTCFEVSALGKYYDNITPTGAGGQPFQIYYLTKKGLPSGVATSLPVAGFITMQFAFILLALIVFIFGDGVLRRMTDLTVAVRITAGIGILFYAGVPVLSILFAVLPRFGGVVIRFFISVLTKLRIVKKPYSTLVKAIRLFTHYRRSIIAIYKKKFLFLKLFGIALLYQIALCSIPFFVLRAFGSPLLYRSVFAMTVFIYCSITFIPTPGNSGVAEASFYALFSTLTQSYLFWAMLIWRFFSYYAFLAVGGGIFAFGALKKRRAAHAPEAEYLE